MVNLTFRAKKFLENLKKVPFILRGPFFKKNQKTPLNIKIRIEYKNSNSLQTIDYQYFAKFVIRNS